MEHSHEWKAPSLTKSIKKPSHAIANKATNHPRRSGRQRVSFSGALCTFLDRDISSLGVPNGAPPSMVTPNGFAIRRATRSGPYPPKSRGCRCRDLRWHRQTKVERCAARSARPMMRSTSAVGMAAPQVGTARQHLGSLIGLVVHCGRQHSAQQPRYLPVARSFSHAAGAQPMLINCRHDSRISVGAMRAFRSERPSLSGCPDVALPVRAAVRHSDGGC